MAKDPAFLFYPVEFLAESFGLLEPEIGTFLLVLIEQFKYGHLSGLDLMKKSNGNEKIINKFGEDENGLFFNKWLQTKIDERKAYSESRSRNRKGNDMLTHDNTSLHNLTKSDIEDENENKDVIKDVIKKENTWREDFNIYKNLITSAFEELKKDAKELQKQQEFNPKANILKSIEKGIHNFWGTEAGWKHKKKSRSKDIDCRSTLINSIRLNTVYQENTHDTDDRPEYKRFK